MSKKRKLNREEEKLWVKTYWALVEKGLNHSEAFELTENKFIKRR